MEAARLGSLAYAVFKPAAQSTKLSGFVPYDLRHTAASLLAAAGGPVAEIAAQQGNSFAVSTSTYQHLIDAYRGQRRAHS
jgi:integrase